MGVLPAAALIDVTPLYRTLVEGLELGVLVVADDGVVLSANASAARILGADPAAVAGGALAAWSFVDARQQPVAPSDLPCTRALTTGADQVAVPLGVVRTDGTIAWIEATARATEHAGAPVAVVTITDVTARREEIARLHELAERDPVTGLPGARHLEAALTAARERCTRRRTAAALVLVAPRLPAADRRGADGQLRDGAQRLVAGLRSADVVTRIAGDVFAVLLPTTPPEHATRTAERLGALATAPGAAPARVAVTAAGGDEDPATTIARARACLEGDAVPGPGRRGSVPELVERIFETVGRENGRLGLERVCELARELLGVDIAYATEHDATHQHFRALAGDGSTFGVDAATSMPLEATYCEAILGGRLPHLMADLRDHQLAMEMPVTAAARVGAYISVPIRDATGALRGTLCGAAHTARPDLSERDVSFLHVLAAVLAHHLEADDAVDRRVTAAGVRALATAVETRDRYTAEHSVEVVDLATAVGRAMGIDAEELRAAQQVALLHDIGKLGIPDAILHKPGPLTPEERAIIETHPDLGAAIVAGVPELAHLTDAIRAEHERWDGAGYPRGLAGTAIPLASRITFVCDAFHAMTSDRPYRAAMSVEDATAEILRERGAQFCPAVVDGLMAVLASRT